MPLVKFFTSMKWKGTFTEIAQEFTDHKAGIQFDLSIHASVGISGANSTLSSMSVGVEQLNANIAKLMDVVFDSMRPSEERALSSLVTSRPGGADAVLRDDNLLQHILDQQQKKAQGSKKLPDTALTVAKLRREVDKDVDQVLKDNKFFEEKMGAVQRQLDQVRVTITHESDRVIDAVLAGPHERIVDKACCHSCFE